jgi:hypothetical protein
MLRFAHLVGDHPPQKSEFSSDFNVRSFCFSSLVQVGSGLGEHEGDRVEFRRRLAGAFGVALALRFFAGVATVEESLGGSGIASGDGASTC